MLPTFPCHRLFSIKTTLLTLHSPSPLPLCEPCMLQCAARHQENNLSPCVPRSCSSIWCIYFLAFCLILSHIHHTEAPALTHLLLMESLKPHKLMLSKYYGSVFNCFLVSVVRHGKRGTSLKDVLSLQFLYCGVSLCVGLQDVESLSLPLKSV